MAPSARSRWLAAALCVVLALFVGGYAFASWSNQAAMLRADPETILQTPALRDAALASGEPVYRAQCAGCHGPQGKGDARLGAPDLTDAKHLYGEGLVAEIEQIARHGIRSEDKRGWRLASMPAYASQRPYAAEPLPPLSPSQIEDVVQFVTGLHGDAADGAAAARGATLYQTSAGCWDCHGHNAAGDPAIGAPSLVDGVWQYGSGGHDDLYRSIARGRAGVCPAFQHRLSDSQLRSVAVYVASLEQGR